MQKKPRFKDQCDNCKKFDYLKSFKGKCLCSKCLPKKVKQLSLFDMEVKNGA